MSAALDVSSSVRLLQAGSSAAGVSAFGRFVDATGNLLNEKADLFAKAIYQGIDWAETFDWVNCESDPEVFIGRDIAYIVKLAHAPGKFASELGIIGGRIAKVWESDDVMQGLLRALYVVPSVASSIGYGVDTLKLLKKLTIAPITKEAMLPIEQVNAVALVIGQGWSAVERLGDIAQLDLDDAKDSADFDLKFNWISQHLLDLAKSISYVALGIISVLSLIVGMVIPPVLFLAFGTSTTFFTVLGHFHKKLTNL